ncbi:hypothetical protein Rhow_003792 [Rhodococcus wratislaviensis]|uniref:DUF1524 domain-containing protein n=1 Tax=Rhodococcus wratislaviensis TaxID=44752 RepID=A0A402C972_RHOWR|nr:hypothetical protein [Rhodococcus wratislaviensis]GCE40149.1 hypothetical protein Rhow_003792 [Rhodococcus wratislaviensis]
MAAIAATAALLITATGCSPNSSDAEPTVAFTGGDPGYDRRLSDQTHTFTGLSNYRPIEHQTLYTMLALTDVREPGPDKELDRYLVSGVTPVNGFNDERANTILEQSGCNARAAHLYYTFGLTQADVDPSRNSCRMQSKYSDELFMDSSVRDTELSSMVFSHIVTPAEAVRSGLGADRNALSSLSSYRHNIVITTQATVDAKGDAPLSIWMTPALDRQCDQMVRYVVTKFHFRLSVTESERQFLSRTISELDCGDELNSLEPTQQPR